MFVEEPISTQSEEPPPPPLEPGVYVKVVLGIKFLWVAVTEDKAELL